MKTIEKIAEEYAERLYPMDMIGGGITKSNRQLQQNACKKAFIEGYNMDRWIPVSEADVPEDKYSIFYSRGLTIVLYKDIYGNYYTGNGDIWADYISHWQPLPPPPKTVTND